MSDLAAVVALLALSAVTAHVAETSAGVASGLALSATVAALLLSAITALLSTVSTAIATSLATLSAVAGNVAPLSTLVALLSAGSLAHGTARGALLGAFTADVAGRAAAVACLLGLGACALAAQMSLLTTVVASGVSLGGALSGTVGGVTAVVASTATGRGTLGLLIVHCDVLD